MADMKWVFTTFHHRRPERPFLLVHCQRPRKRRRPFGRRWKMSLPGNGRPQGIVPDGNVSLSIHPDCMRLMNTLALRKLMTYLLAGDVYVTNFTSTLTVDSPCPPATFFPPAPGQSVALWRLPAVRFVPDHQLVHGAPPSHRRPTYRNASHQGTRRRGKTETEDEVLRKELAASQKTAASF